MYSKRLKKSTFIPGAQSDHIFLKERKRDSHIQDPLPVNKRYKLRHPKKIYSKLKEIRLLIQKMVGPNAN